MFEETGSGTRDRTITNPPPISPVRYSTHAVGVKDAPLALGRRPVVGEDLDLRQARPVSCNIKIVVTALRIHVRNWKRRGARNS
jgi:hypothetical protein